MLRAESGRVKASGAAERIRTSDGRELCVLQRGDLSGVPVMWLHGTPGCRLSEAVLDDDLAALGVRVISYDRPGYGCSSRLPGRAVADSVLDAAAIADALGLDRFLVTGRSGGGPHALAVACGLPDRVVRVRCVAGFAPYAAPGLDWFAGMDPGNVEEFRHAATGTDALTPYLSRQGEQMLQRLAADPATFLGGFGLSDADRSAVRDPVVQAMLRRAIPEALRGGVGGWVDDDLAVTRDWGFDLAAIAVPVEVEFGLADVVVPPAHGRWLAAAIPGAVALPRPGAGHLNGPDQELAMLRSLLTPPPPP